MLVKKKFFSLLVLFFIFLFFIFKIYYIPNNKNENFIKEEKNVNFELIHDGSFSKFVGRWIWFNNKTYKPSDLIEIVDSDYIKSINKKWKKHQLRKIVVEKLDTMAKDFFEKFNYPLVVYSAYRSYDYQKNNISKSCKINWFCAYEWESEHQLWLAIDFWETTNKDKFIKKYQKEYDWLQGNAYKYWFHQSYQKWIDVDGYPEEPWHWRYLWEELALYLYENNISFTEFYKLNSAFIF